MHRRAARPRQTVGSRPENAEGCDCPADAARLAHRRADDRRRASYPHWLPPTASEQADRIDFVFWYVTAICIVIYAIVIAALVYSAWKFRAAPDDDADGPPIHGHTGLEVAWTAIPFALVTSMAIISAVVLARNDRDRLEPAARRRHRAAVRLDVQVPAAEGPDDERPQAADQPAGALHAPGARRHPLVLGSGIRAEAGRRARDHDASDGDAEQDRDVPDHLHRALRPRPCRDALDRGRDVAGRLRQVGEGRRRRRPAAEAARRPGRPSS